MEFKHHVLPAEKAQATAQQLQHNLIGLVDLALSLKQAHWNVVGKDFRSIHLQLDEIIETVRESSDEVAERIVTIGVAADGRSATVAKNSFLPDFSKEFTSVEATVEMVADSLAKSIEELRKSIEVLGDLDPISEDLVVGVSAGLEKHLWMVQSRLV